MEEGEDADDAVGARTAFETGAGGDVGGDTAAAAWVEEAPWMDGTASGALTGTTGEAGFEAKVGLEVATGMREAEGASAGAAGEVGEGAEAGAGVCAAMGVGMTAEGAGKLAGRTRLIGAAFRVGSCGTKSTSASPPSLQAFAL